MRGNKINKRAFVLPTQHGGANDAREIIRRLLIVAKREPTFQIAVEHPDDEEAHYLLRNIAYVGQAEISHYARQYSFFPHFSIELLTGLGQLCREHPFKISPIDVGAEDPEHREIRSVMLRAKVIESVVLPTMQTFDHKLSQFCRLFRLIEKQGELRNPVLARKSVDIFSSSDDSLAIVIGKNHSRYIMSNLKTHGITTKLISDQQKISDRSKTPLVAAAQLLTKRDSKKENLAKGTRLAIARVVLARHLTGIGMAQLVQLRSIEEARTLFNQGIKRA